MAARQIMSHFGGTALHLSNNRNFDIFQHYIMESPSNRVVIAGPRIAGNMIACRLKMEHPELDVVICGRTDRTPPLVGESLTEFSTQFLYQIGMKEVLEKEHFPKYGLTFYYKEDLNKPESLRYAVHEAPEEPPMPAHLINRWKFDQSLRERSSALGVRSIECDVREVELSENEESHHRVTLKPKEGQPDEIQCRWFIDATGRSRLLGKKLGLHRDLEVQRDTFWFRITDFDRSILTSVEQVKKPHENFDSYFTAHHFLGKSNWIWCIPMEDGDKELMSIGIVCRTDTFDSTPIRNLKQFLEFVEDEHPHLCELIRSGRVVDTNSYCDYMYEATQVYSPDRWFLVGDSADTSDPLYSTGLLMVSIQCCQISSMIGRDLEGKLSPVYIRDLELAYKSTYESLRGEIADLYSVIHDPYQAHWRVHLASASYFFFVLPTVLGGFFIDDLGARIIRWGFAMNRHQVRSLNQLIQAASKRLGPRDADQIPNLYDESVNWNLYGPNEADLPGYLVRVNLLLAKYRWRILRHAGWWNAPKHSLLCVLGALNAGMIRLVFLQPISRNRFLEIVFRVSRVKSRARV
jgi:2-polyprenyl-6-methoxyphenol hydroxylase-like FAD-dependent oxidoreductase